MQLGRVSGGRAGRRGHAQMDMAVVEVVEKAMVDETEGVGEGALCGELVGKVEGGGVYEGEGDEGGVPADEDVGGGEEGGAASAGGRMVGGERVEEETEEGGFSWRM